MFHPLLSPVSRLVLGTVQVYCALFHLCVVYLSSLYRGKRSEVSVLDGVFMYTTVCRMVAIICFDGQPLSGMRSVIQHTSVARKCKLYACEYVYLHVKMINTLSAALAEEGVVGGFMLLRCFLELF